MFQSSFLDTWVAISISFVAIVGAAAIWKVIFILTKLKRDTRATREAFQNFDGVDEHHVKPIVLLSKESYNNFLVLV